MLESSAHNQNQEITTNNSNMSSENAHKDEGFTKAQISAVVIPPRAPDGTFKNMSLVATPEGTMSASSRGRGRGSRGKTALGGSNLRTIRGGATVTKRGNMVWVADSSPSKNLGETNNSS